MIAWGEVSVERVLEFDGPGLDPFFLLPELTQGVLDEHRHWLEPYLLDPASGKLRSSFHSFVIRTPRSVTVVDTCGGNDKQRPNRPRYHMKKHPYLERLAAIGVRPQDVNYVLCTHLHGDHVGQNTRLVDGRWVPTFPNAKYLISRVEWNYWVDAANRRKYNEDLFFEDSVQPILDAGLVQFIDDGFSVDRGISAVQTPGHTPGHLCVRIEHEEREVAMMSGDLMHNALQVSVPALNSCFCVDAAQSRATRHLFLEHCHDNATLVLPAHFPTPTAGRVMRTGGRFHFGFDAPFPTLRGNP